jgi:hypothetical protein
VPAQKNISGFLVVSCLQSRHRKRVSLVAVMFFGVEADLWTGA